VFAKPLAQGHEMYNAATSRISWLGGVVYALRTGALKFPRAVYIRASPRASL
jgi:hypothetical protein